MDCLLPDVLEALSGGSVADIRMIAPPAGVGPPRRATVARPGPLPLPPGKLVYGESLEWHVDGRNFTVQWSDPTVDPARAAAILDQLERAWTVFVDEEGWPAPASSQANLLWVILDPILAGSGYTTVYTSDEYPDGYPVTYLNPVYEADDPAFGLSVAVHEFGHMLQYRLRDWQLGRVDSWYWEATSEWMAERGAPTLDTYAQSTFWYADWPDARFDSTERWHPYGMVLLNAWLDERVFGFTGVRDVWLAAEGNEIPWDVLVTGVAAQDFGTLVADMAAEVAAGTLRESALYEVPRREASHGWAPAWEVRDLPGLYGTYFIDIGGGAITVQGEVEVAYVQGGVVTADAPDTGAYTVVVTAVGVNGDLAYGTDPPREEEDPPGDGCGCAGASGAPGPWLGLVAGLAVRSRRR